MWYYVMTFWLPLLITSWWHASRTPWCLIISLRMTVSYESIRVYCYLGIVSWKLIFFFSLAQNEWSLSFVSARWLGKHELKGEKCVFEIRNSVGGARSMSMLWWNFMHHSDVFEDIQYLYSELGQKHARLCWYYIKSFVFKLQLLYFS